MKTKYLLPHSLKLPGWIILSLGICFGIFWLTKTFNFSVDMPVLYYNSGSSGEKSGWFTMTNDNSIWDELAGLFLIVGCLFITLSKEKIEDELRMKIRNESLLWAIIINSVLLISSAFLLEIFTIGHLSIIEILTYNIVSLPLLYLIKYNLTQKSSYSLQTKYILPRSFKTIGWIILMIGLIYWLILIIFPHFNISTFLMTLINPNFIQRNHLFSLLFSNYQISEEINGSLVVVGSLFVALSKEKFENELVMKIRWDSLRWAVLVNWFLIIFALYSFYFLEFFGIMMYYSMTVPLLFIIKYEIALKKGY